MIPEHPDPAVPLSHKTAESADPCRGLRTQLSRSTSFLSEAQLIPYFLSSREALVCEIPSASATL